MVWFLAVSWFIILNLTPLFAKPISELVFKCVVAVFSKTILTLPICVSEPYYNSLCRLFFQLRAMADMFVAINPFFFCQDLAAVWYVKNIST